ncbi:MAG: glycosyltransferase [Pseudoalteromonas distincta]
MKILHLISTINPEAGGTVEGIKQLCSAYPAFGVEPEIACCDSPDSIWHTDASLPKIHALGPASGSYAFAPNLKKWLIDNRTNYDAIVVDGLWQYHGRAAHTVLADTDTPYYVFTHGMLDPWFKRTYPLKHLKKWLYWPWAEYRTLRDARAVIFTCEEERRLARQSFWLYNAQEEISSYGTVAPPKNDRLSEAFLERFPELVDKRLILFLSRIHEKKGCDLLIEAFARIAKTDDTLHLVMAGPDQSGWISRLKIQADQLGIAHRVSWPGMLQGADKWGAYYASDVFCLPSHQENFGIVVAEALACGKPVLISNKVNIWREIHQDEAGFVAEDSVDGTEANLRTWLALSGQEYQEMCDRAQKSFSSRFHIERAAERLIEIIKRTSLVDRKNKHAAS